ncbi:MAG: LptF/LptG family permease, partial [Phaeodactylibacter sp.]|nr:LptF/LptG family permease [Phaeodactylibacter sp.]
VTPIMQINLERLDSLDSFIETMPIYKRTGLYSRAKTYARTIHSQTSNALKSIQRRRETRVDFVFEFHNKFSMAVACILFLFIGAPMGAIVRKGGFGYPLLIAIVFFIFYMVLTILSKNVAENFVIDAVLAAWIPCLVLFPLGFLLTYFAMNSHKITAPTRLLRAVELVMRVIRIGLRFLGFGV